MSPLRTVGVTLPDHPNQVVLQLPRVKIHELHRATGVAQAKCTTGGRIGRQGEPLGFLVVAGYGHIAALDDNDEALIVAGRRALEFDLHAVATNPA